MMKAVVVYKSGGIEQLVFQEVPTPQMKSERIWKGCLSCMIKITMKQFHKSKD